MGIEKVMEIIKKIGGVEEKEELPDDVTRDKHLRSLRRMRRTQNEEIEKEQLKKQIAEFNTERTRKHMFGIKGKLEKRRSLIDKIENQKKVNVLEKKRSLLEERSMLDNKKKEFKKKDINILSDNSSFMGRGNI